MLRIRAVVAACCIAALTLQTASKVAAQPVSQSGQAAISGQLAKQMQLAGGRSGAYVVDLTANRVLFSFNASQVRIPASVNKLYVTATALAKFGTSGTLSTTIFGDGEVDESGIFRGDIYIKGTGDPTFGSSYFNRRAYGSSSATVTDLVDRFKEETDIKQVVGRIYGDASYFDSAAGTEKYNYRASGEIGGQLSGLAFDRGLTSWRYMSFQRSPAVFAANALYRELKVSNVKVSKGVGGSRRVPGDAIELAKVDSPPMATLARLTNRPSDNYLAEMLLKGLGARFGTLGSTSRGARVAKSQLAQWGIRPQIADGSGLSRANRTTPAQVVKLLSTFKQQPEELADSFRDSLAVAGRSGTLAKRMRKTAAAGRCQAKTGTLRDVSALAGYCTTAQGHDVAFAFLMNGVYPVVARRYQDRMTVSIVKGTSG